MDKSTGGRVIIDEEVDAYLLCSALGLDLTRVARVPVASWTSLTWWRPSIARRKQ